MIFVSASLSAGMDDGWEGRYAYFSACPTAVYHAVSNGIRFYPLDRRQSGEIVICIGNFPFHKFRGYHSKVLLQPAPVNQDRKSVV